MPRSTVVAGTGSAVPDKILSNEDLEKIVDTSDEWIVTRTGIKERRVADDNTASSDLAVEAAKRALESAGIEASELDLIVVATVTPDSSFPSTACLVQDKLGIKGIAAFDISAACSGFIYGLSVVNQFIKNGTYNNVLLIGSEILSKITDWTDRNTCVLLGDGAGAVVLQANENGRGIISLYLGADGGSGDLLKLPAGGSRIPVTHETVDNRLHYVKMKGNELFKIAVRVLVKSAEKALSLASLSKDDVDLLIPHQANMRIIKATADKLGLPLSKVCINVDRYGNTSSASIPIALDEAVRAGKINEGDIVVLDAFGGGLTWGAGVIRW